jgi:molybdenum cofactor cytidylyltransferase
MLPTVIVLASGRGERFWASGGSTHKLQANLAGKAVLQHTLDAVKASGLPWHLEVGAHPGMGDSIAAAVNATPHSPGWLILPADLPLIQSDTLRAVAEALKNHEVVLPVYLEQRGHPVGFSAACGAALMNLTGDKGAGRLIPMYESFALHVDDVGCLTDIDTVDDLLRAERWLAG